MMCHRVDTGNIEEQDRFTQDALRGDDSEPLVIIPEKRRTRQWALPTYIEENSAFRAHRTDEQTML
jgi:hypothetical protein